MWRMAKRGGVAWRPRSAAASGGGNGRIGGIVAAGGITMP